MVFSLWFWHFFCDFWRGFCDLFCNTLILNYYFWFLLCYRVCDFVIANRNNDLMRKLGCIFTLCRFRLPEFATRSNKNTSKQGSCWCCFFLAARFRLLAAAQCETKWKKQFSGCLKINITMKVTKVTTKSQKNCDTFERFFLFIFN